MATSRRSAGLVICILLLGLAAGGWYYWKAHQEKTSEFYTAPVSRGEIVQTVTATGTIKPLLDILVSSQISGYVNRIFADFNDKVKAGQLLCTLLPDAYRSAVNSAEGDLENAEANYDLQKVTLARDKDLLNQKLLAQSDYDTQAALLGEAAAVVKIKDAALATARTNLAYCRITAPIDGIVIARNVDQGNSVAVSLSAPTLFEIANDLTKMQIDASVAEADIGNVADGQAVNFTVDAYPNRQFRGAVYQVRNAPQTVQNVVTYDVMIDVNNADLALKPGMTANVSIVVARRSNALRIANSAIRFHMPEDMPATPPPPPPPPPPEPNAAPAPPVPAAKVKRLTPEQNRQKVREIMLQVGYTPVRDAGLPSPEVIQRMKKLAAERGVQLPERFLNTGNRNAGTTEEPITRVVYRLRADDLFGKPEGVWVKLGITDGSDTEVIDGLGEGDVVVTGLTQLAPMTPASNPFGGGGRH
jgi:HlyD family secretion protein